MVSEFRVGSNQQKDNNGSTMIVITMMMKPIMDKNF